MDCNKGKVSVIIPVYNTAPYLRRCLDSVLQNTYADLEVICINDGSKDNSLEILHEYEKADKRIVVIDQPNGGISVARNAGLDIATGEYISFVDSDDWIHPQFFELLISGGEVYDCCYSPVQIAREFLAFAILQWSNGIEEVAIEKVLSQSFERGHVISKLYKKSAIGSIRFPVGVRLVEDIVFNLHVLCNVKNVKLGLVQNPAYFYFQRQDSEVHTGDPVHRLDAVEEYIKRYKQIGESSVKYELILQAYKTIFASRYLTRFHPDREYIHKRCQELITSCNDYIGCLPFSKRIMCKLFSLFPAMYRLYRILGDRTLLAWERAEKQKRAESRRKT